MDSSRPALASGNAAAAALSLLLASACTQSTVGSSDPNLDFDCGVAPVPGDNSPTAYVSDAGVVTFDPVSPGATALFSVAVQDSANVDETITGATLTGPGADAFDVASSFPILVPAGQQALVAVRFAPVAAGTFSAQLVLQTAHMGPSPVALSGSSP
jgi:hypothetical protein